jgi:hypothetical protein
MSAKQADCQPNSHAGMMRSEPDGVLRPISNSLIPVSRLVQVGAERYPAASLALAIRSRIPDAKTPAASTTSIHAGNP